MSELTLLAVGQPYPIDVKQHQAEGASAEFLVSGNIPKNFVARHR
ncbi:hypothetical protein [Methylocucumis oryzae]|nr:hypothetical protein [Methylocucumis oryzae]